MSRPALRVPSAPLVPLPFVAGAIVLGGALTAWGFARDARHALYAYLAATLAGLTVALGALVLLMIVHTARARWIVALRRVVEALAATLPAFAVLLVPVLLHLATLYPWARTDSPGAPSDPRIAHWLAHVHRWLAPAPFVARTLGYLAIWSTLAWVLTGASRANDRAPSVALLNRQRFWSAAGLPLIAVTLTLAAYDWLQSLDAGTSSTMAGVAFFASCFTGGTAVVTLGVHRARSIDALPANVGPSHFHALGRLLLTSVIFWAYIAIAPFVLVWLGNLPREASYFLPRVAGGWRAVLWVLGVMHFGAPFLLLLLWAPKLRPRAVAAYAWLLLLAHLLEAYWDVVPASGDAPCALDLGPFALVVGIVFGLAARRFAQAPAVPLLDPGLPASLRYEVPR